VFIRTVEGALSPHEEQLFVMKPLSHPAITGNLWLKKVNDAFLLPLFRYFCRIFVLKIVS